MDFFLVTTHHAGEFEIRESGKGHHACWRGCRVGPAGTLDEARAWAAYLQPILERRPDPLAFIDTVNGFGGDSLPELHQCIAYLRDEADEETTHRLDAQYNSSLEKQHP